MRELTKEQQDQFREQGFLRVPQVFSEDLLNLLKTGCTELAEEAKTASSDFFRGSTYFGLSRSVEPFDKKHQHLPPRTGELQRVTYPYASYDVFNQLRTNKNLLSVVSQILGKDLVQIVNQVNFNAPGKGTGFGWHQDYRFRRQGLDDPKANYVQCLLAIDRCSAENGGVRFVPTSQNFGPLKLDSKETNPADYFNEKQAVTPTLEPGDVCIFGPMTVHGSTPNRSLQQRRVFINGFANAHHCSYGLPVMVDGKIVSSREGMMEYEQDPGTLAKSSKY